MGEITQKYLKMEKNEKKSTYFVHILKKKKIEIKILLRRPLIWLDLNILGLLPSKVSIAVNL